MERATLAKAAAEKLGTTMPALPTEWGHIGMMMGASRRAETHTLCTSGRRKTVARAAEKAATAEAPAKAAEHLVSEEAAVKTVTKSKARKVPLTAATTLAAEAAVAMPAIDDRMQMATSPKTTATPVADNPPTVAKSCIARPPTGLAV